MTNTDEEQKVIGELFELLEPPVAGFHFREEGSKVLLYAMVPLDELPAGILGATGYWLYQVLGKLGDLGRLVYLLSQAVKQWLAERSKGVPLVA